MKKTESLTVSHLCFKVFTKYMENFTLSDRLTFVCVYKYIDRWYIVLYSLPRRKKFANI